METEDKHKDNATVLKVEPKYWLKIMESSEEYLRGLCCVYGVLLMYVVRKEHISPEEYSDPVVGTTTHIYSTHDEEIIAQAPI
eukprot:15357611-Ditylum_brightwellii.AAC.1